MKEKIKNCSKNSDKKAKKKHFVNIKLCVLKFRFVKFRLVKFGLLVCFTEITEFTEINLIGV